VVASLLALLWACEGGTSTTDSTTTPDDTATDTETPTDDTGPDPDADGDGFPVSEDCDDNNASTFPGAEEWCDHVDHDCNGDELEEGVCGKPQLLEAVATGWYAPDQPGWGYAEEPTFLGDLDGERGEELGILTWYPVGETTYQQTLALVSDPLPSPGTSVLEAADHLLLVDSARLSWYLPAGDFNGDGQEDLWVIGEGNKASTGRAHLFLGPSNDWPEVGYLSEVATTIWEPEDDGDRSDDFGLGAGAGGDYNGDGLADFVVTGSVDALYLVPGRESVTPGLTDFSDDVGALPTWAPDYAGFSGDQDGDGQDDLFVIKTSTYWFSGADLPESGDVELLDFAKWLQTYNDDFCDDPHMGDRVLRLGDWSGDGIEDLAAGCAEDLGTPEPEYTLHVIDGAGVAAAESGTSLFSLSLGSWVTSREDLDAPWQQRVVPDMDGDGLAELFLNPVEFLSSEHPAFQALVLRSGDGMPGPYSAMDPSYSFVFDLDPEGTYFFPWDGGDFDGDGRTDLAFSVRDKARSDTGGTCYDDICASSRLVMGWDVPWDEAFYW